jgi:hypothetical protein
MEASAMNTSRRSESLSSSCGWFTQCLQHGRDRGLVCPGSDFDTPPHHTATADAQGLLVGLQDHPGERHGGVSRCCNMIFPRRSGHYHNSRSAASSLPLQTSLAVFPLAPCSEARGPPDARHASSVWPAGLHGYTAA